MSHYIFTSLPKSSSNGVTRFQPAHFSNFKYVLSKRALLYIIYCS